MRLAANSLSHTGRTPGLQCTNASAGQDFFLRAHDSLMKATKNASPTRDQWLHTPNEIAFLSPSAAHSRNTLLYLIVFLVKIHNNP